jgi:hypothetical protein
MICDSFDIWIELEEYNSEEQTFSGDEFCNAIISFADGSRIGINVWSRDFFYSQIEDIQWINGQVAILPDIVVSHFDSASIRQAITNLIVEDNWLKGRGFPINN